MKHLCVGSIFVLAGGLAPAYGGTEYCQSGGGPTVCVRFDNLPNQPAAGTDFDFSFSNPQAPNIILQRGDNGTTMYEWRVWSKDAQEVAAAIGSITAPGAYNYSVTIKNDADEAGAFGVTSINLSPSGNHYSNVAGGIINGGVTGDVVLVPDSGGIGGELNLEVYGNFDGDITVNKIYSLVIDGAVPGVITADRLIANLGVGIVSGDIHLNTVAPNSFVSLDALSGTLTFEEIEAGQVFINVTGGIAETAVVNIHNMGSTAFALFGSFGGSSGSVRGIIQLWDGISSGSTVRLNSELRMTGVIDLKNSGIAATGSLLLLGGGSGQIINGGSINGNMELGAEIPDNRFFTGTAEFEDAGTTATVYLNGLGDVSFSGTFDGEICGPDFVVEGGGVILPGNVVIDTRGSSMTVCETQCSSTNYAVQADTSGFNKGRFISFSTAISPADTSTAIRVALKSLHHVDPPYTGGPSVPFTSFEEQVRWVGAPQTYCESGSVSGGNCITPFKTSLLQCTPHYQDWSTVGLLHVSASAIVPSSIYHVQIVPETGTSCSAMLETSTLRWGDVKSPYGIPDFGDVSVLVDKFRNQPTAPIKARSLLAGIDEFGTVNLSLDLDFSHIMACVDAFRGTPYPYNIASCP